MTQRLLRPEDEAAFVRLIRAAYGDSYAHQHLYAPGGLTQALASGRFTGFVDAAPSGELYGHTALLHKDPTGDFLESGLSVRNLRLEGPDRTPIAESFRQVIDWATPRAHWLHQHTSTLHPFAQRHATRHMAARPTGFVLDYSTDEHLAQVQHGPGPMHALTMTTELRPGDRSVVPLPRGRWFDWLEALFRDFGYPVRAVQEARVPVGVVELERIEGLGLVRRVVGLGGPLVPDGRVDLVEVPTDNRIYALSPLIDAGWTPVGIRPGTLRPPSVVCQRIHGDPSRLNEARLVGDDAQDLRQRWLSTLAAP